MTAMLLPIRRKAQAVPLTSSSQLVLTVAIIITVLSVVGPTTTMAAKPPPRSTKPPPSPPKSPKPPPPVKSPPFPRPSPPPQPPPEFLSPAVSGTLRLVRGSSPLRGRLEVKVGPVGWFTPVGPDGRWATICDDGSFTTSKATMICKKSGYLYGRAYYESGVNSFGDDEVDRPITLGNLECERTGGAAYGHSMEAYPVASLMLFSKKEMTCQLYLTTCSRQVLVGLECSNKPFPRAPPPPPVPPSPPPPPPPPPSMENAIELKPAESNLVQSPSPPKRVELLVNSSSDGHTGPSVWAPLCASSDNVHGWDMETFATTMCRQPEGFKWPLFRAGLNGVLNLLPLPTEPVTSVDDFDPSKYTHWVTVVGDFFAYTVQDMQLQVSTTPCASGYMLGLYCYESVA
ncbi:hypothetical protein Vafri_19759 [Volvox africanus]|uniref:SRCR domain-containing protein n=1 Tax=Volvox africanus TaxID=51714 RepID=A0A8J4BVI8_9CHLO|nr:hypothetical protein Vafri_19759 [Volvox africanus]